MSLDGAQSLLVAVVAVFLCCCSAKPPCVGPADCPGGSECVQNRCQPKGLDRDGDGLLDAIDPCPDLDPGDELWRFQLSDHDGDGVGDLCDNCPDVYNPDQLDSDGDKIGDACSGIAYLEDELYNDSPASAPLLPFDRVIEGTIGQPEPEPDVDYFIFDAHAGEVHTFRVFPWPTTSQLDPVVAVIDLKTLGADFARINDDDGTGKASFLEVFFPKGGQYVLMVADVNNILYPQAPVGGIRYGYHLEAHRIAPPDRPLPFINQRLPVTLYPGRLGVFTIQPPGPALLSVSVSGGGTANPEVAVQDARTGQLLAYNDNRLDCKDSVDSALTVCLPNGPVRLLLDGIGLGGDAAEFQLDLVASEDLGMARAQDGRLSEIGTEALFRLPPSAAAVLSVGVAPATSFSPSLEVLECDPWGALRSLAICSAGPADSAGLEVVYPGGKQLFARVGDRSEETPCGNAPREGRTFVIRASERDLAPVELVPGSGATGWIPEQQGAIGSFFFQAQANLHYTVTAAPVPGSAARPYLALWRAQPPEILARATSPADPASPGARLEWVSPIDEELQILVSDMLGGGGSGFGQNLVLIAEDLAGPQVAETSAPNETFEQAQILPAGSCHIEGSLGPEGVDDVDFLAIPVRRYTQVSVSSWLRDPDPSLDTVLTLLDQNARPIAWNDDQDGSRLAALPSFPVRQDGFLVLRVEKRGPDRQTYLLQIQVDPTPADQVATPVPDDLFVNEALVDPGSEDINGDGIADLGDQYLEVINASPYLLDLSGLLAWGAYGTLAFPVGTQVAPGEAILLFNGTTDDSLFPVRIFSRGSREPWLGEGVDAVKLVQKTTDGLMPTPIHEVFIPKTRVPGEAWNRIRDADPTQVLRPHSTVVGSIGKRSPGRHANGDPFAW